MSKKTKPAAESATTISEATKANDLVTVKIPLDKIEIRAKKDRTRDEAFKVGIDELAASIAENGLINPITVFSTSETGDGDDLPYELVAGERRLLAARKLGWTEIPATVMAKAGRVLDVRAAENLQRADLNDDQKALTISELIDREVEEVLRGKGLTRDTLLKTAPVENEIRNEAITRVARRIGWKPARVRSFAFIGELPAKVRALAAAGRLSVEHCRVLAMVPNDADCERLAKEVAAGEDPAKEPMGDLQSLARQVNREMATLGKVPWDKSVEFAGGPACDQCPNNSLNRTGLFDGHGKGWAKNGQVYGTQVDLESAAAAGGVCLKLACFRAKTSASKGSIRGAGDRIAAKLRATPAKDRQALESKLVSEAVGKVSFVLPTVFGKQVRERIKAKLATAPAKKTTAKERITHYDTWNSPKAVAERTFQAAKQVRSEKIAAAINAMAAKFEPKRIALLGLTMVTSEHVHTALAWQQDKRSIASLPRLLADLKTALEGDPEDAMTAIGRSMAKRLSLFEGFQVGNATTSVEAIAGLLGMTEFPPVPKLEDFLPKPAAVNPPKKSNMSPPAKPKGGKRTPGKKKAKATAAKSVPDIASDAGED